jgi:hypothetical protein
MQSLSIFDTENSLSENDLFKKMGQGNYFAKRSFPSTPTAQGELSKDLCSLGRESMSSDRASSMVHQSHDVIGRMLDDFKRGENSNMESIEMPMVFLTIYQYFTIDEKGVDRIRTQNLFKVKGKKEDEDKLEKHVALANYKYLLKVEDPHVVATFFKSIIKYMAEPLCKYSFY